MKKTILLFLFGILLLALGTGQETGVTGKDEYWVTFRTPLEMMETGSYWTLRLNDEIRLEKPPLVYWVMTALYRIFGVHLWSARLVGVLSGAGMAVLTMKLYERVFHRSGVTAGLVVLAMAGVAVEGRRAMLDMPLGVFCLWSVYLAVVAVQKKNIWCAAGSGAALAAATLAKGPQSLLFVLPALLLGWIFKQEKPELRFVLKSAMLFTGVFLLLALPWPLSMRVLHADFLAELENQIVTSRLQKASLSSPLNALGGALLLVFPWSFLLLTGMGVSIRRWRTSGDSRPLWLAAWLGCCVLPFFFMKAFERYMIPILPCAALLVVWTVDQLAPRTRKVLMGLSVSLLAVLSLMFAALGFWFRLSSWEPLLVLVMVGVMLVLAFRNSTPKFVFMASAGVFAAVLGVLYPTFGVNRLPEHLPWEELEGADVGVYSRYSQPAMLSMRLKRSVDWPREHQLVEHGYDGYIFTTAEQFDDPDRYDTLTHALTSAGIPFSIAGRYPVMFSRRNWIKLTPPDVSKEEIAHAFRTRDLSGISSEILYVKTGTRAEPEAGSQPRSP